MKVIKSIVPSEMTHLELMYVTLLLNSSMKDVQFTLSNGCDYIVSYDRLADYENQLKMYNKKTIKWD